MLLALLFGRVLVAPSRGVTLGGGVVSFARLSGCPRRLVGADHSAAIQCCHSMLTVLVSGVCPGIHYSVPVPGNPKGRWETSQPLPEQ